MKTAILIILSTILLAGCADTALTGAGAAYDRYSIAQSINDQAISSQARSNIYSHPTVYDPSNISVATLQGNLLLVGQVPSKKIRERAAELAASAKGVKKVYNFLTVGKNVSLGTQLNDSWITTKIKSQFLTTADIDPAAFKIITENGVVFLMGSVAPKQAAEAVKLARTTNGVKEVVKIFQYIHLSPTPYKVHAQATPTPHKPAKSETTHS